jgi:CRP-like cAMP-binding protein
VQGEPSDAVFYIQKGRAKLTVLSTQGKEATIVLLGEGDFMGEGCITSDQPCASRLLPQLRIVLSYELKRRRC